MQNEAVRGPRISLSSTYENKKKKGKKSVRIFHHTGFLAIRTINHGTVHSDDVAEAWSVAQTRSWLLNHCQQRCDKHTVVHSGTSKTNTCLYLYQVSLSLCPLRLMSSGVTCLSLPLTALIVQTYGDLAESLHFQHKAEGLPVNLQLFHLSVFTSDCSAKY